jgi:hypothetical protein
MSSLSAVIKPWPSVPNLSDLLDEPRKHLIEIKAVLKAISEAEETTFETSRKCAIVSVIVEEALIRLNEEVVPQVVSSNSNQVVGSFNLANNTLKCLQRIEFQHRGPIHLHTIVSPSPCKDSSITSSHFYTARDNGDNDIDFSSEALKLIMFPLDSDKSLTGSSVVQQNGECVNILNVRMQSPMSDLTENSEIVDKLEIHAPGFPLFPSTPIKMKRERVKVAQAEYLMDLVSCRTPRERVHHKTNGIKPKVVMVLQADGTMKLQDEE